MVLAAFPQVLEMQGVVAATVSSVIVQYALYA